MFSGLIGHWGTVAEIERPTEGGMTLHIAAPSIHTQDVQFGDSIAIDGVCLTVISHRDGVLAFDVIPETVDRSTLGDYVLGQRVNMELSLRFGDRLGGHLVYAHVDTRVRVLEKTPEGQGFRVTFERPQRLARFIVEKGYVALDGISLTVASTTDTQFSIALIPETAQRTTFADRVAGADMNLEIDPIARYVADIAAPYLWPVA
jgi:riboflavin synthase